MIPKLRWAIDNTENPKLIILLGEIAKLPDNLQEGLLECIEAGVFSNGL